MRAPDREYVGRMVSRVYVVGVYAFIFAPIIMSFLLSFSASRFPTFPLQFGGDKWYVQVWGDPAIQEAFLRSLIVACIVSLISTVIGFTAAYTDYRFNFLGKKIYLAMAFSPPMVPLLILAIAMLFFFSRIGLAATIQSVVIAHIVLTIPFAMAVTRIRLAQMDSNLESAAWNLGASQWRAIFEVILPFCLPALVTAVLVCAAISFDEYTIAWFNSGFSPTLPVEILERVRRNFSPAVNAIGSITFSISMTLVIVAQVLMAIRRPHQVKRNVL